MRESNGYLGERGTAKQHRTLRPDVEGRVMHPCLLTCLELWRLIS